MYSSIQCHRATTECSRCTWSNSEAFLPEVSANAVLIGCAWLDGLAPGVDGFRSALTHPTRVARRLRARALPSPRHLYYHIRLLDGDRKRLRHVRAFDQHAAGLHLH